MLALFVHDQADIILEGICKPIPLLSHYIWIRCNDEKNRRASFMKPFYQLLYHLVRHDYSKHESSLLVIFQHSSEGIHVLHGWPLKVHHDYMEYASSRYFSSFFLFSILLLPTQNT